LENTYMSSKLYLNLSSPRLWLKTFVNENTPPDKDIIININTVSLVKNKYSEHIFDIIIFF
jgi:hypothetical protein